jgi:hypothetical protein
MIPFNIILDGAGAWPDLAGKNVFSGNIKGLAVLKAGTRSGRPSVALRIETVDDGEIIIAQTTARLFCSAARAIMARYPDLFEGED